jgi:hypothetical protein
MRAVMSHCTVMDSCLTSAKYCRSRVKLYEIDLNISEMAWSLEACNYIAVLQK